MDSRNLLSATTSADLIAPCGIDCRLCRAYMREKAPCAGCRGPDTNKSPSCANCRIKNCKTLAAANLKYCFECSEFPCFLIERLDKRYRAKYSAQPIENLLVIQRSGIESFVEIENRKWRCPRCGSLLCMHDALCPSCGYPWRERSIG